MQKPKTLKKRKNKGQAIVEYIIIIVIVAVAALAIMGTFSDRIRAMIAGVANTFGAENAENQISESSVSILRGMDEEGLELDDEGGDSGGSD